MSTSPAAEPAAAASPIVRFDQVGLARRSGEWMLRGLSFALAPQSFHWLTGPRGSGKTSLLRLMGLADRPSQGIAQVFGRDAATLGRREAAAMRRRIGLALDPAEFADHLSVWDNAAFAARVTGRQGFAGDVDAILKWLGLARTANALPGELTAADRHRLALARALVNRPELLLIDEPSDGFAPDDRQKLFRLVAEVHSAGACVVMVSRDDAFAAASGRPVIRLMDGRASLSEPEAA
jgi:cell division transport system ATP-binding protein